MDSVKVLIVEDDPMVADINKNFTEAVPGFQVVGIAKNGKEALQLLPVRQPDLVLLDVYMPELDGVEVLSSIRHCDLQVDVMLITAAGDTATIAKAMRQGVVDYIIKPFKFERYKAALDRYREYRRKMLQKENLVQSELDSLLPLKAEAQGNDAPKNFHIQTMSTILDFLAAAGEAQSAEEVASGIGISRVTARRYLEYLVTQGRLQMVLEYISVGRPVHRFRLK